MTAVLAAVALALVAALVVLVDVKPWRRPPVVETFTVTISVNASSWSSTVQQVGMSAAEAVRSWNGSLQSLAIRPEDIERLRHEIDCFLVDPTPPTAAEIRAGEELLGHVLGHEGGHDWEARP